LKRRDLLSGASVAALGTLGAPRTARSRQVRHLTMLTDWPEGPGVLPSARRLARAINETSQGSIFIDVSASGAVVRPFETFDAVQSGVADMFHSHIGYFEKKSPAFHFYSGVPFGLTANELYAWIRFGGGQELWDELGARFGIKPLACSSTGSQMGGWFLREIESIEDFKGLRYRMAGLGGVVFRRLGATVVNVPGADITLSLRSGAIEACEWVGPWLDMLMGLHEAAGFYYYPAWQEPGTAMAIGINRDVWNSLEQDERSLIENAAAGEFAVSLAEFNANNALALARLKAMDSVVIRPFSRDVLAGFAAVSQDVVAEAGSSDEISQRIYQSYTTFRDAIREWSAVSEGAYLGLRELQK
jgi:TRAP-type mannitol/chloroaromatic compound transport system substrate-binding protein